MNKLAVKLNGGKATTENISQKVLSLIGTAAAASSLKNNHSQSPKLATTGNSLHKDLSLADTAKIEMDKKNN